MTTDGKQENATRYWKRNLRILFVLLTIWATVSYLFGIVWVDWLNQWRIPGSGFKLGFWFAQQGAMYVFVVLIFVYARLMAKLDAEFNVQED